MKFGKSAAEAAQDDRGGAGGDYIRYLKEGPNTFRILQEPDEWLYYFEHFSPAGFSFPCPRGKNDPVSVCPGCSSDNDKMSKVSRKIAFNVLMSFNGTEYVNAFKIGPMVSEKLENRFKRFDTITDRDYTITKYKTSADRWDFDVEGGTPTPVDLHKDQWKDIEALLAQSYEEAWGDPQKAAANSKASDEAAKDPAVASPPVRMKIDPAQPEEPPFEQEKAYKEADLRRMDPQALLALIKDELKIEPPSSLTTTPEVVDWLMALQS
jgi:hypothetical protein